MVLETNPSAVLEGTVHKGTRERSSWGIFTAMTVCHPENLLSVCSDSKTGNEETWLKEDPGVSQGIIADAGTERECKTGLG